MVYVQNHQGTLNNHKNNKFAIDYLKGSIGQAVIATYLREFKYEIYPYGYENNYANITRFIKRDYSNATFSKLRSMPDLLVFDRDNEEVFLLQIKVTSQKDESRYWIKKEHLYSYKKYWPEALLIIYYIPTANIYCRRIGDIKNYNEMTLSNSSEAGYYLKTTDFSNLPDIFQLIKLDRYKELREEIKSTLKEYTQVSTQLGMDFFKSS